MACAGKSAVILSFGWRLPALNWLTGTMPSVPPALFAAYSAEPPHTLIPGQFPSHGPALANISYDFLFYRALTAISMSFDIWHVLFAAPQKVLQVKA